MGEDRTDGRCDQEALVQLLDGALRGAQRREALAHLEGCAACQRQARWLGRVEGLLGPLHEGHPASSMLSAYAAGELSAEQRHGLAEHLQGCAACRGLERAAAAGLAEAELVERSQALLEQHGASAGEAPLMIPELHLPFAVAVAPQAPALAANSAAAPLPRDRRVLLEEPGSLRLVYYRLAGQAQISLFAQGSDVPELELEATLDDAPLSPARDEEGNISLDLGPAVRLPGRTLRLVLGQVQRSLAWTFVEEEEEEDDDDAER